MILLSNAGPSTDVWTLCCNDPLLLPLCEPGSQSDDRPFWTTGLFQQQLLLGDLTSRFFDNPCTPARALLVHVLTDSSVRCDFPLKTYVNSSPNQDVHIQLLTLFLFYRCC